MVISCLFGSEKTDIIRCYATTVYSNITTHASSATPSIAFDSPQQKTFASPVAIASAAFPLTVAAPYQVRATSVMEFLTPSWEHRHGIDLELT